MVELNGALRHHRLSTGLGASSDTLFSLGVMVYPTAQNGGFGFRTFTLGGQIDF